MATFTLETRDGSRRTITGKTGVSLLKLIRRAGVEELVAQCGGGCACATCHVYLALPAGTRTTDAEPGENRMLSTTRHRQIDSRLACQIKFEDSLDGMEIRIAPEDTSAF